MVAAPGQPVAIHARKLTFLAFAYTTFWHWEQEGKFDLFDLTGLRTFKNSAATRK